MASHARHSTRPVRPVGYFKKKLLAKTLLRLRCISPKWNACISNQFFINSHSLQPRPISGLFSHHPSDGGDGDSDDDTSFDLPAYAPFNRTSDALPDPSLSFLPEPVAVATSARGLLCYRGHTSGGYYVCNPTTSAWATLPPSANAHGADPTVAIIFDEPGIYNFHADYRIICAYPITDGDCDDIYEFEMFSFIARNWAASAKICPAERILARSGVTACGKTYWQTTMEEVVAYDPVGDA